MALDKIQSRFRIRKGIASKVRGTADRPRLSVFRSNKSIYAQIIDDANGVTVMSASSLSKDILKDIKDAKSKVEKSKIVGKYLGEKAVEKGISEVVFDRSGYRYHGRVQAVAEGAREGGLKF